MTEARHSAARVHFQDLRWLPLWIGVWIFGWALCIVLSLIPPPPLPPAPPLSDKIGHCLAYATLAAWAVQLFATRRALVLALLALAALGLALEYAQGAVTTTRLADPADALANTIGVLIGASLAHTPARHALRGIERMAAART